VPTELEKHIALRVADDRGVSIGEALEVVQSNLRRVPLKVAKPQKKASSRKKKKRAKRISVEKKITPAQKIAKRFGPDNGRQRGGSPFLQGGAPGLGKR
jgi:hypothetical protein